MGNNTDYDVYYLVGQNIKKQRKFKKMTQLQLAEKSFLVMSLLEKLSQRVLVEILFLYLLLIKLPKL